MPYKRPLDPESGLPILSPGQQQYLEWLVDPERTGSHAQWARDNGWSEYQVGQWRNHNQVFRAAWEKRATELNLDVERIQEVITSMHRMAVQGDVRAAKLILDYVERIKPPQPKVVADRAVAQMTDEELAAHVREGLTVIEGGQTATG